MPFGAIGRALICLALLVPTACASHRMSTRDIYGELLWGEGVVCTPNAIARREERQDERFSERIAALRPWLEAQVGRSELAQMIRDYHDEMANIEIVGCPSEDEHSHRRTRRWTLLHELENRARHAGLR